MDPLPRYFLLAPDLRFVRGSKLHQGADLDARVLSLARALAHSPIWDRMGHGVLVVRTGAVPALAAFGRFDEADEARLSFLARWLAPAVTSTTYLDQAAVEGAIDALAERLRATFGNELRTYDFVAVPRGGLIVLGMLAYALDLDGERLGCSHDPQRPRVVVDDCALTGSRFRRFVAGDPHPHWVFAHLCSPPALRTAMLDQETRLSHAIAANDLRDLAPAEHGAQYEEWRARVEGQAGADRYWIGQAESVVFPWNEPDHNFWNAVTNELEWGWRLAPPEVCRKAGSVAFPDGISLQVHGSDHAGPRVADHVLYARFGGNVHLLHHTTGRTLQLDEVGSHVWDELIAGSSAAGIADGIASRFDVDADRALADVQSLTQDLITRGMLVGA